MFKEVENFNIEVSLKVSRGSYGSDAVAVTRSLRGEMTWQEVAEKIKEIIGEAAPDMSQALDHAEGLLRKAVL